MKRAKVANPAATSRENFKTPSPDTWRSAACGVAKKSRSSNVAVSKAWLNETNMLELYVFASEKHRQALLVARLDNLGKGASGAAVQNMRLMLGFAET